VIMAGHEQRASVMSIYADNLREFFNHNVTDDAANEIERLEAALIKEENQRDALLKSLSLMAILCRLKYGNLDADVYAEIEKSEQLIKQAKGQ
jgi:hypothetical protein